MHTSGRIIFFVVDLIDCAQSFDEMGTVGFTFEVLDQADVPAFQEALLARSKGAIAAGGIDWQSASAAASDE